jgi:hypothetical protein
MRPSPILACLLVAIVAGCGPVQGGGRLSHPTLGPAEQRAAREACLAGAQSRLGAPPAAASPAPCREDGDAQARDRCRAAADLALVAQTRYISRLDAETDACLRAQGFRD